MFYLGNIFPINKLNFINPDHIYPLGFCYSFSTIYHSTVLVNRSIYFLLPEYLNSTFTDCPNHQGIFSLVNCKEQGVCSLVNCKGVRIFNIKHFNNTSKFVFQSFLYHSFFKSFCIIKLIYRLGRREERRLT